MAGPNFWGYTSKPAQTFGTHIGETVGKGLGNVLEGLAQGKAQKYKVAQNKQLLQGLGINPEIASALAPHSDENIFKFLSQFEGFDIGSQQPQQQSYMQNQPQQAQTIPQNQPNYPQQQGQNQPNVNEVMRAISGNPELAGQISPEQIGQLLQNQATQQALNPLGIQSKGIRSKGSGTGNTADQELKREKFETAKQDTINKKYAKVIEQYEKDYTVGSQLEVLAQDLKRLNEEIGHEWSPYAESATNAVHKVSLGFIDPRSAAGKAAEEFRNKANQYVHIASGSIKGLPSKFRVQILEASKPSLAQSYEARENIIEDAEKFSKSLQVPYEETLRVTEENNGNIPSNFSSQTLPVIKQKQREILKGNQEQSEGTLSTLPPVSQAKSGKGYQDESTGKIYTVQNGKWVIYKG